jgi:hypothetical protein
MVKLIQATPAHIVLTSINKTRYWTTVKENQKYIKINIIIAKYYRS